MKTRFLPCIVTALCGFALLITPASAAVPQLVAYQGRVAVGTVNFDGAGQFKFALITTAGATVSFWSNDNTSVSGSQPTAFVTLTVTKGLYSVLLGDTSLTNMTVIPASVWTNADVRLRVWFNDGTTGFQQLTPDQRLAPNGYPADGSVSTAALAANAVTAAKIASGAVGNTQIASGLDASKITTGTFPALSGANLTGLNAGNLTGTLPAISGANLTSLNAGNLTGTLPAISGANLTGLNAGNIATGTLADLRLSANIPQLNAATNAFTGGLNVSTAFVVEARPGSTGIDNLFIGVSAGSANTTGQANLASGTRTLAINTSGSDNTALGFDVLRSNTTGSNNAAGGAFALRNNSTGHENTAWGNAALFANTTGFENTACGNQALNANTSGGDNTAVGISALLLNTTASNNTAGGAFALRNNTTGNENTAWGSAALTANTTGRDNTACGYQALTANTTGNDNSAYGSLALSAITTGFQNTAVGGAALRQCSGTSNTAIGYAALFDVTTGSENTAIGSLSNVGGASRSGLVNGTAIGYNAIVDASNKVRLGDSNVTVIEGQVSFTSSSDRNLKENFRPVDGEEILRKIREFHLTSWNFIGHDPQQFRHYGPMAQDFFAAFGHDAVGTVGTSTTINSGDMAGVMFSAIQALANENATMRGENAALKKQLAELEAKEREREAREKEYGARLMKLEQSLSPATKVRATAAALHADARSTK